MRFVVYALLLLAVLSCSKERTTVPFVPAWADQWDWDSLSPAAINKLPVGVVTAPYKDYSIQHIYLGGDVDAQSLRIIVNGGWPDNQQFELIDYEGYIIRHYTDLSLFISLQPPHLLISDRVSAIEAALDAKSEDFEFDWPRPLEPSIYCWEEPIVEYPPLAGYDENYSLYQKQSDEFWTQSRLAFDCECPATELLSLIPFDARQIRLMPDWNMCYASFTIGQEPFLIADYAKKRIVRGSLGYREVFGPFEIDTYHDATEVKLSGDWHLIARDAFSAQIYLERHMAGSSQIDQPTIQAILQGRPELQFLRQWHRRSSTQELAAREASWWAGSCSEGLIHWQAVAEGLPADELGPLLYEYSFAAAIEQVFVYEADESISLRLADGSLMRGQLEGNWEEVGQSTAPLLGPIIPWGNQYAWQTTSGWYDGFGSPLQANARVGGSVVYLEALDETIVLLPESSGRILALRSDGSSLPGWEEGKSLKPAEVPILHLNGPDYDHFFQLDTTGVLTTFDLQGEIIRQSEPIVDRIKGIPLIRSVDGLRAGVVCQNKLRLYAAATGSEQISIIPYTHSSISAENITSDLPLIKGPKGQTVLAAQGQSLLMYRLEPDL